ncbi:MAG: hypothetical protein J0G30_04240 [Actinomycetales bacterium]|nr:hypothetical protein [Actinomycetales bacterium]
MAKNTSDSQPEAGTGAATPGSTTAPAAATAAPTPDPAPVVTTAPAPAARRGWVLPTAIAATAVAALAIGGVGGWAIHGAVDHHRPFADRIAAAGERGESGPGPFGAAPGAPRMGGAPLQPGGQAGPGQGPRLDGPMMGPGDADPGTGPDTDSDSDN